MRGVLLAVLACAGLWTESADSSKILALIPCNSRSHFIVMAPLLRSLAERGHQLTVVSPFPLKTPLNNYTDIDVSDLLPPMTGGFTVDFIKENLNNPVSTMKVIWDLGYETCKAAYEDKRIQGLINTTAKYDLVVTEIFSSDCFVPFAHKLEAPLVSIVTSVALPWTNDRIGNPDNPSYIVNYFHSYDPSMSLAERLANTFSLLLAKAANYYASDLSGHRLAKRYFGEDLPPLEEIYSRRTALVLANSYYTVNQPRPFVPNFIEIGGIHLQKPTPLPKELQTLLDNATDGFIFFSLGSIVKASSMHPDIIKSFLDAFAELKQLVLWKFDGEIPDRPSNVVIRKWLPQKDILVHRNVKVFITHGGLSSTLELVNAGVPVLGIPMFADQPANIFNLVRKGVGLHMDYDSINKDTLLESLNKIINDQRYMENAKRLSRQFKDRPQTPLETAVFWMEHVLRHRGADHMRSPAADLPLYKLLLLDVVFAFSVLAGAVLLAAYSLAAYTFRILFKRNAKTEPKNKKEKSKKER